MNKCTKEQFFLIKRAILENDSLVICVMGEVSALMSWSSTMTTWLVKLNNLKIQQDEYFKYGDLRSLQGNYDQPTFLLSVTNVQVHRN